MCVETQIQRSKGKKVRGGKDVGSWHTRFWGGILPYVKGFTESLITDMTTGLKGFCDLEKYRTEEKVEQTILKEF